MSDRDRSSYDNVDVGRERGIDYQPASVAESLRAFGLRLEEACVQEAHERGITLPKTLPGVEIIDRAAERIEQLEREREQPVCGENASPIPADMVGCGEPIEGMSYRCTHCHVLFHHACAEKHFQSDDVLTEEMVVEIERRAALTSESRKK